MRKSLFWVPTNQDGAVDVGIGCLGEMIWNWKYLETTITNGFDLDLGQVVI